MSVSKSIFIRVSQKNSQLDSFPPFLSPSVCLSVFLLFVSIMFVSVSFEEEAHEIIIINRWLLDDGEKSPQLLGFWKSSVLITME